MENRLERLRLEIDKLIREKRPERDQYFFSHLYGVSHFCTLLAIRRNLNAEIAAICGMLHDIYPVLTGSYDHHAVKGAEQAESILRALGLFRDDEINTITAAISRHSGKGTVSEPMDEVLKDADVMHHCLYDASAPVSEKETARYASILAELGCAPKKCKAYPLHTLGSYQYADIMAVYEGKWIFCKHKMRTTWENPGGHIEKGESPLEAAKRELYEETGATDFDIEPLCDYWFFQKLNGVEIAGRGQAFFANVHTLSDLPSQWEMEKIGLFDAPPHNLTYPDHTSEIFPLAVQKRADPSNAGAEQLAIPGAGGIIIKEMDHAEHILLQTRSKPNAPRENGLLEIPAGKIRAFESIFDTLKREVKEETGLTVTEILGEGMHSVYEGNHYRVINFTPFSCAQNVEGDYPVMVLVFICRVTGDLLPFSNESKDYRWMPRSEVKRLLAESPQSFYPMHIDTLRKYCGASQ